MDDLISRQAAIDAVKDAVIKDEQQYAEDALKALPPVYVPDTNVGDMISRQTAMEMLMAQNVIMDGSEYHNGFNAGVNRAQEVIRNLPPVQPKHGKWLPDNRCGGGYWVCSSCKYPTEAFAADVIYKYCPFCGADMRGEVDG